MARMDNNIAVFRGQIEEMLGKMEQSIGSLQGPRGTMTVLRGRELEMRGRARQTMGRVRMGFENVTGTIRERGFAIGPIAIVAIGVSALAIFSPHTLNRAWHFLRSRIWPLRRQIEQSPLAEQAQQTRRTLFGGPMNR